MLPDGILYASTPNVRMTTNSATAKIMIFDHSQNPSIRHRDRFIARRTSARCSSVTVREPDGVGE